MLKYGQRPPPLLVIRGPLSRGPEKPYLRHDVCKPTDGNCEITGSDGSEVLLDNGGISCSGEHLLVSLNTYLNRI